MIQVFNDKSHCCGCTACEAICPQKAITMREDTCGFFYPVINQDKCVDCGLCKRTCSFNVPNNSPLFKNSFVVKHRCKDVVNASRSGGFFSALSDFIIEKQGVVYGSLIDENMIVRHDRAITKQQKDNFRKSKYVQSNLNGIFLQIMNDLKQNKWVLFTGVPCQCDALKTYVSCKSVSEKKLLICDLVCHSNASPGLFKKYLDYQSQKYKSRVKIFSFRDKDKFSWWEHVEKIEFENKKIYYTDEYTNLFYTDNIRPSCFNCKYTSLHRTTDITMADCWGGEKKYSQFVNKKGASLILVNTEKGVDFFKQVEPYLEIHDIDIEDVMQPRLREAEQKSETYENFWKDYISLEFNQFMKKYGYNNYSRTNIYKRKLKRIIGFLLRKIVRRPGMKNQS